MTTPVPSVAEYKAAVQLHHGWAHTYRASGAVGWLANTTAHQYDAEYGLYYIKDITGDAATWDSRITRAWQEYNYYVNTFAFPCRPDCYLPDAPRWFLRGLPTHGHTLTYLSCKRDIHSDQCALYGERWRRPHGYHPLQS